MELMQPGDKAIIYLNSYHMNFSRTSPWNSLEVDYLWLPENIGYQKSHGIPKGLRIRTENEMQNLGTRAMLEVEWGGYELLDCIVVPLDDQKFTEALNKLDVGIAQILVTYASMLPKSLVENGLPTEALLARARKHGWRIGLINLQADPDSFSIDWKSEYVHLVIDDISDGVLVSITNPSVENYIKNHTFAKKKWWNIK
jgi:hypothetical protein